MLVVSHFYHFPRIKLAYQRDGWEVYTVPARESYLLRQTPYNMAREVAALWVYYCRPLTAKPMSIVRLLEILCRNYFPAYPALGFPFSSNLSQAQSKPRVTRSR